MAEIDPSELELIRQQLREDLEFELAVRNGTLLPPAPTEFQSIPLPAGVDGNAAVTYADFLRYIGQLGQMLQHEVPQVSSQEARKVALGIGGVQEAEVVAANPIIGQMPPGPARTKAICDRFEVMRQRKQQQEAMERRRAEVAGATPSPVPTPVSPGVTPPQTQPHIVPDPETAGPSLGGVEAAIDSPSAELEALQLEYQALPTKYRNPHELAQARKKLTARILEVQGLAIQEVIGQARMR